MRLKSSQEIASLRQAIATNGRPEIFARLAELYRYLGRFEEALEVAHAGIDRYPDYSGNHLAIGRIHYTRFLKTGSARDGRKAAECLTAAYELDPQNFKTLSHLATLYITAGDRTNARIYLGLLGKLLPGDSHVSELWERLNSLSDEADDQRIDHFRAYEARRLGSSSQGSCRLAPSAHLDDQVAAMGNLRGVSSVYLVDPNGRTLAAAKSEDDPRQLGSAVHTILEAARINARRMSIGTFTEGVATYGAWKVFLYDFDGVGAALFADDTAREDQVRRTTEAFATQCLSGSRQS
jgi:tetratricopeptide (TPR) repeat protein